jgi:heme/copper-type cytochrome/quinol oxidase subunit 2
VTTGPPGGTIDSTTSTGPIETTTTTVATTTTTTIQTSTITVSVVEGKVEVTGDTTVPTGARVSIQVTADVEDTATLVGYDLTAAVAPDAPATMEFSADESGTFPMTLDTAGLKLFDLEVTG